MLPPARSTALQALVLAGLAGLAALISNSLASPSRRLAWGGSLAPPAVPPLAERSPSPPPLPPSPVGAPSQPAPSDRPAPPAHRREPAPTARPAEVGASTPIREISGEEARQAFQAGAPFLDARRSAEFAEGHIPGAWCTPVWEADLGDRLISFKAARRPGPDDPIVIYCSGGDCRDSHLLAAKLLNDGYFHLLIYRDGFPDWVAQHHPVERSQP
jgi:rhodanese-related sulfurtransferase